MGWGVKALCVSYSTPPGQGFLGSDTVQEPAPHPCGSADVAQSEEAFDSKSNKYGFESHHRYAGVIQWQR